MSNGTDDKPGLWRKIALSRCNLRCGHRILWFHKSQRGTAWHHAELLREDAERVVALLTAALAQWDEEEERLA